MLLWPVVAETNCLNLFEVRSHLINQHLNFERWAENIAISHYAQAREMVSREATFLFLIA